LTLPVVGLLLALVVLAIGAWGAYAMRNVGKDQSSATTTQTSPAAGSPSAASSAQAATGQPVTVAVKVTQLTGNDSLVGTVTKPDATGKYATTGQQVEVHYANAGPLVMGGAEDVRAQALLQVIGTSSTDGAGKTVIEATQLVKLTGFVQESK
jgi:uncharacterized protein (UPF0333 family)